MNPWLNGFLYLVMGLSALRVVRLVLVEGF